MNIIYFSTINWDSIKQRPQHIALELSKNHYMIYVEPHISLFSAFLTRYRQVNSLKKINENLFVYSPPFLLPFGLKNLLINNINKNILLKLIAKIQKKLDFYPAAVFFSHPSYCDIAEKILTNYSFYDCMDEYSEFNAQHANQVILNKMEENLIKKVGAVIVSSNELYKKKKNNAKKIYLIPNGVNYDFFVNVQNDCSFPCHSHKNGNPLSNIAACFRWNDNKNEAWQKSFIKPSELSLLSPVIGYLGTIADWLDTDIIEYAIKTKPDWWFVFIGPVQNKYFKKYILKYDNVLYIGKIPYEILPHYLKSFSIGIIPFKINTLTIYVNPVKLYEYLATGLPVVSSALPDVVNLNNENLVSIYTDKNDFIKKIEQNLYNTNENKILRQEFAKQNTWANRVQSIEQIIAMPD